jgi:hypothetical protein
MGAGKWNEFVKLVKYAYLPYNWFLVFLTLVAQFFVPTIAPAFFIFITNLFDVYGYYFVLRRLWTNGMSDYALGYSVLVAYRIIQNFFDYTLLALIWVLFGFKFAFAGWVLKMFGLQDILFYGVLDIEPPKVWTWLKWTPFGLLENLIRGKGLENWLVIVQAGLGFLIYILICYV